MAKEKDCVSCGAEADSKSERNFCADCDAEFEAGLEHQAHVERRAEELENAKANGDDKVTDKLMLEILKEAR